MTKPAILVVDDEPEVLRAIARDLRKQFGESYRVLRASTGAEAVEALNELKARSDPVALVLSDQRMPNMDGTELLSKVRKLFPDSKRALLTAYADTSAAIASINESQIDYYLLKPWDPPEDRLYPVVAELLQDWKANYRPGYGGIKVIGHRWSSETHDIKEFLARNQVPYRFLDLEDSEEASALLEGDAPAKDNLPLVILTDGSRLNCPTPAQLANEVGMQTVAEAEFYDLAIVGAGPAGLAAAVYGASEGLKTVLIESHAAGGQAGTSSLIENYLGFPSGLSGADLARRAVSQASRFGVEILSPVEVSSLTIDGPYKRLTTSSGRQIASHSLMLSMGVSWTQLPVEGADKFVGCGVFYGAAMSEAENVRDKEIYVVGAGNSAGQAAMFFADHAAKVTVLVRGESLAAKMSNYLVERINEHPKIEVLAQTEIIECTGGERLESVRLKNNRSGEECNSPCNFVFVFIGAKPRTEWLDAAIQRDEHDFVLTGPALTSSLLENWPLSRNPFLLETSVPGVFAAGDVRSQSIKRVASAVGEGSVSVAFIHRHLAEL